VRPTRHQANHPALITVTCYRWRRHTRRWHDQGRPPAPPRRLRQGVEETVYALTSLDHRDTDPQLLAGWIRSHWTFEN
jgi:hypothetical protein